MGAEIHGGHENIEEYFNRVYNETCRSVSRFVVSKCGNMEDAEDIIQNVFMKIWIHREALDETMSIKNYIYVLSKREVFNYLRAKYNTHVVLTEDMMTLERPSSIDEPTTDYRELREAVQSVINTMPPKRRSVFCLSRFKSLTNQEIADKLGISIRTVEKHIELALRTFKEQLGSFFALFVGWFL
mgnify:CR=1 FL=1